MAHVADLIRFYELLDKLAHRLRGPRRLADCTGRSGWPLRGVYFFFEPGEQRSTSGTDPRVVRVGTHALTATSGTSLWRRLSAHQGSLRGEFAGGGNHRGSVFRLHVGAALLARDQRAHSTWGVGSSAQRSVRLAEQEIEGRVSKHIRFMPFLWLDVSAGADGGRAMRERIETNAIALLSNWKRLGTEEEIDPPSALWLGMHSPNAKVRKSGLWNVQHVDGACDSTFLSELSQLIQAC